ncbi:MAG: amino acid adenylation domain-containing protein, partial [Proteobacteria bacterium]|nr:amino acid adenylation domain-containing protein [Pseudomonadota bacterium]
VEPSIELMTGVWGILGAGGAYLPLSPEYPLERLKYMIKDSGIKIILTQESQKDKLLELMEQNLQIVTFHDIKNFSCLDEKKKNIKFDVGLKPSNLAYVIYTSGSTGKPKGVMIEHRSIVNQMYWLKTTFSINSQTSILQKTPFSFDAAQWEILSPSCGSKVVMGKMGISKNPWQLIETINKYKVNVLQCVPTLLQTLLDTDHFQSCHSLTKIFCGGEALSKQLVIKFIEALPKCNLINLYGPTECTINTSAFVVDPGKINQYPDIISIGKPIDNIQYYILNSDRVPVTPGEIGELYISGLGVARGYLGMPELTAEKFVENPFSFNDNQSKLYKTGDLTHWNSDGTIQYVGRIDNQVKLRGFRVELDEIKLAIENHNWVKNAAVILKNDLNTGYQNLIAFIELNPKEASLMDQGVPDFHHQSKENKAQVIMQLSNKGLREELNGYDVIDLCGKIPKKEQIELVFARKTYRFFEDVRLKKTDILTLLSHQNKNDTFSEIRELKFEILGEILRYFGQFNSEERLLPKYGYASPGALYATQLYLELNQVCDLTPGYYYYHPLHHRLILIKEKKDLKEFELKLHFIGKKSAIEPIYKNNILEVLEIEVGHMIGLFEKILSNYGLNIGSCAYFPSMKECLNVSSEDFYLGTFEITSGKKVETNESVDIFVQVHPEKIIDLETGLYFYKNSNLEKISDRIILKKHVIVINQEVYNRSSFGISIISKTTSNHWLTYINLGRKLQHLQMNDVKIGLMSSGYSSKTGNDLITAKIIQQILDKEISASYFCIGGKISDEQIYSRGMKEDIVHMKGPAEMIKDELKTLLPDYMIPNKVVILDKMPLTVNGKIDFKELQNMDIKLVRREYIAPRTDVEQKIYKIWINELKNNEISINDDFFELGGNSIIALGIVYKINNLFNISLPLQILFEAPTIEKIAFKITGENVSIFSRLIPLQKKGSKNPIYCWPGLGGYCMNLKSLAKAIGESQPFYGIQAYGVNNDEIPYSSVGKMAIEDIKIIKQKQASGPYILCGYSFGARVAFETAYQLEQTGDIIENLFLIAPGSPIMQRNVENDNQDQISYNNKIYLTILFSVFMGNIESSALDKCLKVVKDEESFINFIINKKKQLTTQLVKKIINIVSINYTFKYTFKELNEKRLKTPITIIKAKGDDYSFIETMTSKNFDIIEFEADHYHILKKQNVKDLAKVIRTKQFK